MREIGEVLVREGLITRDQLLRALAEQRRTHELLGRVLIDLGMIKEVELMAHLAEQIGFRFVDLTAFPIDPSSSTLLDQRTARRLRALPLGRSDEGRLLVAMADPVDLFALDDIRTITGAEIEPVLAVLSDIESAIRRHAREDDSDQGRSPFHDGRYDRVGNLIDLATERARRRSPFSELR